MNNISVIIPTFNRKNLLRVTLSNILSQSLKPYEIIVVDDNSSDGTEEMLVSEFQNLVIYVKNLHKGPGAARNMGLRIATGDFIKFFDSDDLMSSNSLESQVEKLKETGKQYVTSPYLHAYEKDNKWIPTDNAIINYHGFPSSRTLTHWMIWGLFITIPGMLFRKDFLDKVGFWPEEMISSEDWAYLWRIAMLEPFPAHTNECAFIYRVHEHQSTGINLNNDTRDREKFRILQDIYDRDIHRGSFNFCEKALFRNKFYQIAQVTSDINFKSILLKKAGRFQFFVWQWYRIRMKVGRIITKSNWQPFHGAIYNQKMTEVFIQMCSGK